MTDRELLEMAAKAVGVEYIGYVNGNQCEGLRVGKGYIWNPLKDDGDAFGIMVELGLRVQYCDTEPHDGRLNRLCMVTWMPKGQEHRARVSIEESSDDPYKATRRALVRAAALLGGCQ